MICEVIVNACMSQQAIPFSSTVYLPIFAENQKREMAWVNNSSVNEPYIYHRNFVLLIIASPLSLLSLWSL